MMARVIGTRSLASTPALPQGVETFGTPVPLWAAPKGIDRFHTSTAVGPEFAVKIRNLMFDQGNLVSRLGTNILGLESQVGIVMQVVDFIRKGNQQVRVRFCTGGIEVYVGGAWNSFPLPFTGGEDDFFAFTGWADKILFSNGIDGLWEFDFGTQVAKLVPEGPSAKHLTTFGLRVVASFTVEKGGDFPVRVKWSANRDYTKWRTPDDDPAITADISGGFEDLYGAPEGVTDEAMGVFPFSDEQAWLVRSRSTWQMSVSGNILAPFRFDRVLAGVGTTLRHTIVSVPTGIVFLSRENVHLISPNGHDLIGHQVMDDITDSTSDPLTGEILVRLDKAYGTYDTKRQEYRVAVGKTVWRYRLQEKGWTADIYPWDVRALSRQIPGIAGLPIDMLVDIIDTLSANYPPGTIDDLVLDRTEDDAMMFVPASTVWTTVEVTDPQDMLLDFSQVPAPIVIESGFLKIDPLKAIELHGVNIEYECTQDQTLIFEVSFTDGDVWEPYSMLDIERTDGSEIFYLKNERVSRKLRIRLRSETLGDIRLLGLAPILISVERVNMASNRPKPAAVIVSPSPIAIMVGNTQQLTIRVYDASGNELLGQKVSLTSTNTAIATVSGTGLVRAVAAGSFQILATVRNIQVRTNGVVSASAPTPVHNVVVTPATSQGVVGATQQYTARVLDALGNVLLGRTVVWATSNPAIATITSSGLATLTAVGNTVVSATVEGVVGGSSLTVNAVPDVVASVDVTPSPFTLTVGQTLQLTATPRDSSGNALSGKVITWSATGGVTVNATGLVTATAAGAATVTATCETVPGTSNGTIAAAIQPVATVTVTPSAFSKAPGQTQLLTVVLKDSNGNVLTGRVVTFASSNVSIASVDSSGLVTAVAQGNATITVTSEGKIATASATVTAIPVATVEITPSVFSILPGATQQLTVTLRDSNGGVLTGRTVTWGSSDITKATVSSTGLVTAVATGSVTITATSETKVGSSAGTIGTATYSAVNSPSTVQYVPEPNIGNFALFPQTFINTARGTPSFSFQQTINGSGNTDTDAANLQNAINASAARAGNTLIRLSDGFNAVTSTGITLPERTAIGKTYIEAISLSTYAAEGSRVDPSKMSAAPKIITRSVEPAIRTLKRATGYRIAGVEVYNIPQSSTVNYTYILVRLGNVNKSDAANCEFNITDMSDDIVLDRCFIHGTAGTKIQHAVSMNGKAHSLVDSWVSDIKWAGTESHGVASWCAVGPHKIVGNYFEVASIAVLHGGADPAVVGLIPADIEARRNHFTKNLAWKGQGFVVKNHFEIKSGKRCLLEGNIAEHSWVDAQTATCFLFQSLGGLQAGEQTTADISDLSVRYNWIDDVGMPFEFAAHGFDGSGLPVRKVECNHNLVTRCGVENRERGLSIFGDLTDVRYAHNTLIRNNIAGGYPIIAEPQSNVPKAVNVIIRDNIQGNGQPYSTLFASGGATGSNAMNNFASSYSLDHNVGWEEPLPGNYPASNQWAANIGAVGFTSPSSGDYSLSGSSPYKNDASDGTDPGVNWAKLQSAISGVRASQVAPLAVVPGLISFGATTAAGRGGTILRVTNRNDSGAGSLRAALQASGKRVICFEVSGIIALSSKLVVTNGDFTLAGQTAPNPGILIRNYGISIRCSNVLIQHLRVRIGKTPGGGNNDAFEILGPANNIVLDHCSGSWATDENYSTWQLADPMQASDGPTNVTCFRCIVNENLDVSTGGGMLVGDYTKNFAVIESIFAHNLDRHPYLKGGGSMMVANCVIYNWPGGQASYTADPENHGAALMSLMGNRYKRGPNYSGGRPIQFYNTSKAGSLMYVADNSDSGVNGGLPPSDPWTLVKNDFGTAGIASSAPVIPSGFIPKANTAGLQTDIVAHAGAYGAFRDSVDTRIANDVTNGTGSTISDEATVGGFPALANNTRTLEAAGMPVSATADSDNDGYTDVEEWLQTLAASVQ